MGVYVYIYTYCFLHREKSNTGFSDSVFELNDSFKSLKNWYSSIRVSSVIDLFNCKLWKWFVIAVFFYFYCIFLCVEEGKKEKKKRRGMQGKVFSILIAFFSRKNAGIVWRIFFFLANGKRNTEFFEFCLTIKQFWDLLRINISLSVFRTSMICFTENR